MRTCTRAYPERATLRVVIPPVRREALARRLERDEADEVSESEAQSPAARVELALELSELARESAESLGAEWTRVPPDDLAEKARLYARPLAILAAARKKNS